MSLKINPSNPYSFSERLLRTAVFQTAVSYAGWLERFLIWFFQAIAQHTFCPKLFDQQRAEQGLKGLINLGANVKFVTPKDGMASIQMMTLQSKDLESKLHQFGAKWEKIVLPHLGGKSFIAIIPPPVSSPKWDIFEKDLQRLKWKKQSIEMTPGKFQDVIVTCEDASSIDLKDEHRNMFLHSNSASVNFVMLSGRIGFYLGCKQNVCFYDPRGSWKSQGTPSEGGYYNDIAAVYNEAKQNHAPQNIWVTSACGGVPAAAYLKSQVHQDGVNFIFENGFSSLVKDFIEPEFCLVRKLAKANLSGLSAKDIPAHLKPNETAFNIVELWKNLKKTDLGKVIWVRVKNDQRLDDKVSKRNLDLAKKVNSKVHLLDFNSTAKDPHSDRYYTHKGLKSRALKIIFKK